MTIRRVAVAICVLAAACGGSDSTGSDPDGTGSATTTSTAPDPDSTTTQASPDGTSTTQSPTPGEMAVWPAPTRAFATPEEAATDFVTEVLGVPPVLGDFLAGDSRSGEMELLFAGEGGDRRIFRGLLLLRQLGPENGWFILGVLNDNAMITAPASMSEVAAGPVTIEGVARGFEGAVTVTAFVAGDSTTVLDDELAQGGSMETPEPFEVTLDLSDAQPGDVVTVLVRGGTGLDTDPGEIGSIPLLVRG